MGVERHLSGGPSPPLEGGELGRCSSTRRAALSRDLSESSGAATEQKPRLNVAEFRFDPIAD